MNAQTVQVTFTWPKVLLDSNKLMGAILSLCQDMDLSHGPLLSQGLIGCLESFQSRQGDDISSTLNIALPFSVKLEFTEDVLSFENSDERLT